MVTSSLFVVAPAMADPFLNHWKTGVPEAGVPVKVILSPAQIVDAPVGLTLTTGLVPVVTFTGTLGLGQANDLNFISYK